MDSDVPHKLLHRVVLQVAVAAVHLESLVTDLFIKTKPHVDQSSTGLNGSFLNVCRTASRGRLPAEEDCRTHFEALVCGEQFGHGAERDGVGPVLLQRRGRVAHHEARRHQLRGHLRQFELQKLKIKKKDQNKSSLVKRSGGFWSKERERLTWLLASGSPNCLRTSK